MTGTESERWHVTVTFTLTREQITAGDWDPDDPAGSDAARWTREITEDEVIETLELGPLSDFDSGEWPYVIDDVEAVSS